MSRFTSARERRLWLWLLAILALIYGSMGVTTHAAAFLREHNLLRVTVALLFAGVGGGAAWLLLQRRAGRREWGVLVAFAFVCGWAALRADLPEERTHLIEYGCVASLIFMALTERVANGRPVRGGPWLASVVATSLLGVLDEGIQVLIPHRVFDLFHITFNTLAALLFSTGMAEAAGARRWDTRRRLRASPPGRS